MTIGETTIDVMIDKTIIDRTIEGTITETIVEGTINKDIGIEVKVGGILEIIIETIQEKDLCEVEIEVELRVEIDKHDQEQECYQMIERIGQDQYLDLDPIQKSVQIEIG